METVIGRLSAHLLAVFALSGTCLAADNRFILVDQSDWGNKKGFYLDIENNGPDGAPLPLDQAKVVLGVADGGSWRYIFSSERISMGVTVTVGVEISPTGSVLKLDGREVGFSAGGFMPVAQDLTIASRPSWASAPAQYTIEQGPYSVRMGSSTASGTPGPAAGALLSLFEVPLPLKVPFKPAGDSTLEIETSFRALPSADQSVNGLIDRYGQVVPAPWPDKVKTELDLRNSATEEQRRIQGWHRPADWDAYGGSKTASWHEKATGFYRVVKHRKYWWLVSPDGNPLFYTGICTGPDLREDVTPVGGREALFQELPPKTGTTADLWDANSPWGDGPENYVALHAWNLERKFGPDWKQKAMGEFKRRVDAWGFSGQGKWADPVGEIPTVPVLELGVGSLVRHPDIFDEAVQGQVRASLERQITPLRNAANVVGFSIGNEFDEIVTADEIKAILKDHKDSPSARAILANTASDGPLTDDGVERARQFYARAYYGFLYRTVKAIDPNHLYFGFWIVPGWWQNPTDWDLIEPYCDVIGYDRYAQTYSGMENLESRYDKPTLVGEFSFPAWYGGTHGYGRYEASYVETDADSGRHYADWVGAASRDPKCVGILWFEYRDEPACGRGPGRGDQVVLGEHYAFGFVDQTDRPKWDLITKARVANLRATNDRLEQERADK